MYLITNRTLKKGKSLDVFGKTPNPDGPKELRLLQVTKTQQSWRVTEVADKVNPDTVKKLKRKYHLDIDVKKTWHGSLQVACDLFEQARAENKAILFFVHGYNNDVEDVLEAAQAIEDLYNVIVVPFTWPANGGGKISGTASYLSDKSDARVSSAALNRAIGKIQSFHLLLTAARKKTLQDRASKKCPDNPQAAYAHFSKLMEKDCPITLNLLCHSMGNYVFKHTLSTSDNITSHLVFDNICLVAADTNNDKHINWVGQLDTRKRIYVVINEDDFALKAARIKPGDEQLARLGHYTNKLNSPNTHYIDVTNADHVGSEHTYFKGDAVLNNAILKELFSGMFNGRAIEHDLDYHSDNNSYKLK